MIVWTIHRRGLVNAANLKRLTLAYNDLTSASAVALSLLLYKYENSPMALSLTELDLQGNSLGVEILDELAKVLGASMFFVVSLKIVLVFYLETQLSAEASLLTTIDVLYDQSGIEDLWPFLSLFLVCCV